MTNLQSALVKSYSFFTIYLRYRLKLTNLYSWKRFIRFERIIRSGRIIREDDYDVIVSRTVKMVNLKMIYSDLISWPEQTIWTRAERTRTCIARANFLIPSFKLCERTLLELSIWNSYDVHLPWKSRKRKLIFCPNLSNGPGQGQIRNPRTSTWVDGTKTKFQAASIFSRKLECDKQQILQWLLKILIEEVFDLSK